MPLGQSVVFFAYVFCCYPLGRYVFPKIKSADMQALIHFIAGFILAVYLYGWDLLYVLFMITATYYSVCHCRVLVSIVLTSVLLALSHAIIVWRGADWAVDMTGMTMLILQKVIAISLNIRDGRDRARGEDLKRPRWDVVALDQPPSLLRYAAWVITPYGGFSGPFYEYTFFEQCLNCGNRSTPIPDKDYSDAMFKWLGGIPHAIYIAIAMEVITWENVYAAEWYLNLHPFVRSLIVPFVTCSCAMRYFPIWWEVEAGLVAMGMASNGLVPGDELSNMSMWYVCQSESVDDWFRRWNHTTHVHWKNYLFTRMLRAGYDATISNYAVFTASMVWHGFRPVYTMMLPENFLMIVVDAFWLKKFPLTDKSPRWVHWLHWIVIKYGMLYTTSTFFWPWVKPFFELRTGVWFLPDLMYVFIGIVAWIWPKPKTKKE
jgi:hypothetical protein